MEVMTSINIELQSRIEDALKTEPKVAFGILQDSKLVGVCPSLTKLAFREFEATRSNVAAFTGLAKDMLSAKNVGIQGEIKKEILKSIL